jgi:MFS family permease
MVKKSGLLLGISLLWLPLSMLSDGFNTLILPAWLLRLYPDGNQASLLGLISFVGLLLGMFVQAIAGAYSDKLRSSWGRRGMIGLGILLLLPLALLSGSVSNLIFFVLLYFLIQIAANIIQAGLQALLPDLVKEESRGFASGLKNLMDIGGALLVFMLLAEWFNQGQASLIFQAIAIVFLVAYLLTLILVREPKDTPTQKEASGIFELDFQKHRAFVWLILSRFLFLLGTYAVGRFLLFFVAERQDLSSESAGEASANILASLTLITVLAAPLAGWLGDKVERRWLMSLGGLISAIGVLLLMYASSSPQIILFGSLMALGSALFSSANWALAADLAPKNEAARFLALANFGTAGAAACAGIFGFFIDFGNQFGAGMGYSLLFFAASAVFLASMFASRQINTRPFHTEAISQASD